MVDDQEGLRRLTKVLLERRGYETAEAENGREAVAQIVSFKPDLVISDMLMPGITDISEHALGGLELLKYTRTHCPRIKFLMITGDPSVETAVEAIKLGAFNYLRKGNFDFPDLLAQVSACLEQARPLRVFLCHSSSDKPAVRKLFSRLRKDGFDPWLDEKKLLPGQNWQLEIEKAVRDCDVVAVCLSTDSITKEGYVQKEIKAALDLADEKPDGTIFIVPVRLEDCTVPDRLKRWQWVDLFETHGYARLIGSLRTRYKDIRPNPNPEGIKDFRRTRIRKKAS